MDRDNRLHIYCNALLIKTETELNILSSAVQRLTLPPTITAISLFFSTFDITGIKNFKVIIPLSDGESDPVENCPSKQSSTKPWRDDYCCQLVAHASDHKNTVTVLKPPQRCKVAGRALNPQQIARVSWMTSTYIIYTHLHFFKQQAQINRSKQFYSAKKFYSLILAACSKLYFTYIQGKKSLKGSIALFTEKLLNYILKLYILRDHSITHRLSFKI